jgi:hypothetical protein
MGTGKGVGVKGMGKPAVRVPGMHVSRVSRASLVADTTQRRRNTSRLAQSVLPAALSLAERVHRL